MIPPAAIITERDATGDAKEPDKPANSVKPVNSITRARRRPLSACYLLSRDYT